MTPQTLATAPALTNPYVVAPAFSPEAAQFLLLLALVMFVVGLLLAEKSTLFGVAKGLDNVFGGANTKAQQSI
jgi:hypothetical protein